ncbi:hypothetical protein QWA_17765 [Alcaligenes faecalis subsp. faecalis NCIB 8687]|nr:hypothetical protein QWA_17765 [Alcaligenes faecalis subsp. faecalis NCIB 8687]
MHEELRRNVDDLAEVALRQRVLKDMSKTIRLRRFRKKPNRPIVNSTAPRTK